MSRPSTSLVLGVVVVSTTRLTSTPSGVPAFSHVGSLNPVLRPAEINAICSVIAATSAIVPPTKHATAGELAAAAPPRPRLELGDAVVARRVLPVAQHPEVVVVIIGIDPHKRTHTASALDPDTHRVLASVLDEQRANLVAHRTRLINQLHASLCDPAPGGADTDLTSARAAKVLLTVRPAGPVETIRKQMARDLVGDVRAVGIRLKNLTRLIADTVAAQGTRLPEVDGIGPVVAARLLGRTGRASPFPTSSAFANYAGVAPIEVASGDRARHRLPRGGDRQLNYALHVVALTQVGMRASVGRSHYDRKISEGKTRLD